ncbi:MAG: hypothetical protein U5K37_09620 [Natrialbaceae archaeon]|nr:hypothetical protein [Natrialbaceae archaeon]
MVVEIEPTAFSLEEPPVLPSDVPAWPAVGMDSAEAERYDRLVLGVVDEDGNPTSWTVSQCSITDGGARLVAPGRPSIDSGQPACLLCHWHSRELENLGQRLIRGRCRPGDDHLHFEPGSSFTLHNETALDAIRFVIDGKRRTRRALDSVPLTWRW